MFHFAIFTNKPGQVADFFVQAGLAQMVDDGEGGQRFKANIRGFRVPYPIPNPIRGNPLKAFALRFAYEMEADDDEGDTELVDGVPTPLPRWRPGSTPQESVKI